MTLCPTCQQSFHRLTGDQVPCNKCRARKPGLSQIDLQLLNNRPQCATCGVMSNNLTTVVCRNCIEFYRSLDTLPKDVFMIPGLLPLLVKPTEDDPREVNQTFEVQRTSSSGSTAVLDLASNFQKTASSSRLGNKPKTGFSLGQYGNIKKAQMVNAERRAKKEDHLQQESTDGPKITVTLWVAFADPEALTFSMKMSGKVRISRVYPYTEAVQFVLDDLLKRVRVEFAQQNPLANNLTWDNVDVWTHEGTGAAACSKVDLNSGDFSRNKSLRAWFQEFVNQRLGLKSALSSKHLELRFVYNYEAIHGPLDGAPNSISAKYSFGLKSKSLKASASGITGSKRKRGFSDLGSAQKVTPRSVLSSAFRLPTDTENEPTTTLSSAFRIPGNPESDGENLPEVASLLAESLSKSHSKSKAPVVPSPDGPQSSAQGLAHYSATRSELPSRILTSAFRVPKTNQSWTKNVNVVKYPFIRWSAQFRTDGSVDLKKVDLGLPEYIEIATDWIDGKKAYLNGENHFGTGFLGRGSTKHAIYARFQGKEYALTQPIDSTMDESETSRILQEEFRLLCQCDGFKGTFDDFCRQSNQNVPAFYFNFRGSFYGELACPVDVPCVIRYRQFLVTPLLPCGELDGKIQKFTGNADLGPASDAMTKAIHAFAHFSLLYSHGFLLFCDLQGKKDSNGVMCLIDPQAHTNLKKPSATGLYWDRGSGFIEKFKSEHEPVCIDNEICKGLGLSTLQVQQARNEQAGYDNRDTGNPKSKQSLDYILLDS